MGKPGVMEYTGQEAQRVALIQDRRKLLGQDPEEGDWGKEHMPGSLEHEEYQRQVAAQLKPTEAQVKRIISLQRQGLSLSDMELWEEVAFSDAKIKYTIDNWRRLKEEYGVGNNVY